MRSPVDDGAALLHAAGWSVGELQILAAGGPVWHVSATNGENVLEARGATQAAAWRAGRPARSSPGRDHWPRADSMLWAGGGTATGRVIGPPPAVAETWSGAGSARGISWRRFITTWASRRGP